ncbi:hypothetical protein [Caloranaerobacter ferrireducens]|uniref:hypothetical protein n=1 Tax=Caloranaerobacter ferrireducens TaxID=1323370 RepID=UPI00084D91F4|nr:hypothetical protein [Caloranaerobacter ferrireducens]
MFSRLEALLEPISKVFNAIIHPLETLQKFTEIILAYIPAVCMVIFLFYVVTGSRKILGALMFTIMVFILLKFAIVFQMTWLIAVVLAAILIIRLIGVVM